MNKRFIDANKLKRRCQKLATEAWKLKIKASAETIMNQFIDFVEEAPTEDAVEVVYCKDCKHFVREDIEEHTPYGFYNEYFYAFCDKHYDKEQGEYIDVNLDDYCSFAERNEK